MTQKQLKRTIKRFNKSDTHLVISRWPGKGKSASFDGIATYTQDTVQNFAKKFNSHFVVLAEKVNHEPDYELVNKNILVLRIFDPKRQSLFPRILIWLARFPQIRHVYVHSEFCASGGPHLTALLIPFLILIRLAGRSITYYAHNVVDNLSFIATHLNLPQNSLVLKLFSLGLKTYYFSVGKIVNQIVVLEQITKTRLSRYVNQDKIIVHPHWVKSKKPKLSAKQAKKRLGLDVNKIIIMSFGFVTFYKGADWLTRFAQKAEKDHQLNKFHFVLAGGQAYSLKHKPYYQHYYQRIKNQTEKLKNLTLTGFIPPKDLDLWFTAADLVILPYRGLIGGSGALQQTLKRTKPFLLSRPMFTYLESASFTTALKKQSLTTQEVAFAFDNRSLKKLLLKLTEKKYKKHLTNYCQEIGHLYSYQKLAPCHYQEVFAAVREKQQESKRNPLVEALQKILLTQRDKLIQLNKRISGYAYSFPLKIRS